MKIIYNVWWKIFFHKYKIKTREDVKESGIYYNEETDSYEAHYKPDERTKTKVVTCIAGEVLNELDVKSENQMATRLVKELAAQLVKYSKTDIAQFSEVSEVMK